MIRLTDILHGVSRPVAYFPQVARAVGGVKQGILLCQLYYWHDKGHCEDGWIYKTMKELEEETGLSRREQETARKALKRAGVLEERHERLKHRLYFSLDLDALNNLWEEFVQASVQSANPEFTDTTSPNGGNEHSGKSQPAIRTNTKNTFAESTFPENTNSKENLRESSPHARKIFENSQNERQPTSFDIISQQPLYKSLVNLCQVNYQNLNDKTKLDFERMLIVLQVDNGLKSDDVERWGEYWQSFWRCRRNGGRPPTPHEVIECWHQVLASDGYWPDG